MAYLNAVIDLSHHNTVTSLWEAQRSGVRAVIHKATQGRTIVDEEFVGRRDRVRATGMLFGAYHFGTADQVADQVGRFLDVAHDGRTLLVLDWESNGGSGGEMTRVKAEKFVRLVHEQTGRWPMLYSGMAYLKAQLAGVRSADTPLAQCPLWLARYSASPPTIPAAFASWTLWQYTDKGRVAGIGGSVDRNKFKGTELELREFWA